VVLKTPLTMAACGLIVAALLFVGALPAFLGLTIVMPVLGHASWHVYRKAVQSEDSPRPTPHRHDGEKRYAADFPAVLFPWAR
jgi:uncharacterized membrane protein